MEELKNSVKENFDKIKESTQNITNNIKENIESIKPETKSGNFNLSTDFLNSNTLIAKACFLLLIIIIFSFLFYVISKLIIYFLSPNETPYLLYGMKDATIPLSIPQPPNKDNAIPIVRSKNQYDGIEFSYSFWMYVNEVDYSDTEQYKHVFHKGSLKEGDPAGVYGPNNCPGVYLYTGKPHYSKELLEKYPLLGMLVRINVFQNNDSEDAYKIYDDIYIDGIPIKKWVCVVLRLTSQNVVDVYINGTLTKRHKLSNLVKQNYDDVYINFRNGGFRGNLSNLRYYNYAIGTYEIDKITENGPNLTIAEDSNIKKSAPQYLSSQWYFNDTDPISDN